MRCGSPSLPGGPDGVWVVRVGGDDGELRPWHYIYVCSMGCVMSLTRLPLAVQNPEAGNVGFNVNTMFGGLSLPH